MYNIYYMKAKIKSLFFKKLPQIFLLLLADIAAIFLTGFLALALRFDFGNIPTEFLNNLLIMIPFETILSVVIFYFFNLYTSIWRYASVMEFLNVIIACVASKIIAFLVYLIFSVKIPSSYFVISGILLIIMVVGIRLSYRVCRVIVMRLQRVNRTRKKTLLVGIGEAGRMVIEESYRNLNSDMKIVCIVDDDKKRKGTKIRDIPIVGGRHEIKNAVEKYKVEQIIIAIPSASKEIISKIVTECQRTDCEIKILPAIFKEMNEKDLPVTVQDNIRAISYEDFLGRDQVVVNGQEIFASLHDKVVLVTGGGGSIGSELCRQIAKCEPKLLVIFDIYENNAYDIQQELYRNCPEINLATIIGSVRDYPRLEKVFQEFKPEIVFHAAAHKHVPLMEVSPNEAIKNNCLGTLNTVKLADKYKVEKFVLISSDKAVRPTNIMGATKRICEMIVQTYDKMSKTNFVAVRFGNVLGSNGSVVPLFLKQIEAGGPVTVTSKEITRFFMTIPEAVSLILQAEVYAEGGEIFVLDMGEPVRIYDLAKQIIRCKGLKPDVDIEIKITGLRPGEKLYEEKLMSEEGMKMTPNKLIHIGKPIRIEETFMQELDDLIKAASKNSDEIKELTAKVVKTYRAKK